MKVNQEVQITVEGVRLIGQLVIPNECMAVVVFAHGSGSSRFSPRNQYVAGVLHDAGIGTLLIDLLSVDEAQDRINIFDVDLLARRLTGAINFLQSNEKSTEFPIGLFGASTGAAAALMASTTNKVYAVVSRGGRPDLAAHALHKVNAPTLLIVGERDFEVLELNRLAAAELRCPNEIAVVPHATHLFEEPGTLEIAAKLARDWFISQLPTANK